jgi:hypothetical protein
MTMHNFLYYRIYDKIKIKLYIMIVIISKKLHLSIKLSNKKNIILHLLSINFNNKQKNFLIIINNIS